MTNPFSYDEYLSIIDNIKKTNEIKDYREIDDSTYEFVVIRHDVEISVERAYEMAKLESDICSINTSYFFQLRNNGYNILSKHNLDLIREICVMGHSIGLHVHLGDLEDIQNIKEYIIKDVETLQNYIKIPIDRFSIHRPSKQVLKLNLKIDGLINTYSDKYFCYVENGDFSNVNIKYFADSWHRWAYGYPGEEDLKKYKKIQLLTHPFSWTKKGYDCDSNFKILIDEKLQTIIETIDSDVR